jgi:hypothetical protein
MNTLEEERKFIEDLIIKNGFSLRKMSIKIGKKESYLHQYVKYGKPNKLADKYMEAIIMIIKKNGKFLDNRVLKRIYSQKDMMERLGIKTEVKTPKDYKDVHLTNVEVFNFNIYSPNPGEREIGTMSIKCDYLPYTNTRVYSALFITSQNMSPTFNPGDIVIYDYCVDTYEGDGVYIVLEPDRYVPKRVIKDAKGILLLKDDCDKRHSTKVDNDFRFYGRVVSVLNMNNI